MTKLFENHHKDYEEMTTETMPAYSQVLHVHTTSAATFSLCLIKLALLHWTKQSTWLRTVLCGGRCLRMVLFTPSGACQNRRRSILIHRYLRYSHQPLKNNHYNSSYTDPPPDSSGKGVRVRVSWSLTSLFSTNMAISETKGQGWKVIRTQWRTASDILTSTLAAFLFSSHPKKGKGSRGSFKLLRSRLQQGRQLSHHKTKTKPT